MYIYMCVLNRVDICTSMPKHQITKQSLLSHIMLYETHHSPHQQCQYLKPLLTIINLRLTSTNFCKNNSNDISSPCSHRDFNIQTWMKGSNCMGILSSIHVHKIEQHFKMEINLIYQYLKWFKNHQITWHLLHVYMHRDCRSKIKIWCHIQAEDYLTKFALVNLYKSIYICIYSIQFIYWQLPCWHTINGLVPLVIMSWSNLIVHK